MTSLVGEIQERKPSSSKTEARHGNFDPKTGFPAAQHRSKSAFARAREAARPALPDVPTVLQTAPTPPQSLSPSTPLNPQSSETEWRNAMSQQNDRQINEMSDADREKERQDILERFGPSIVDLVTKAKRKREISGGDLPTGTGPVAASSSPLGRPELKYLRTEPPDSLNGAVAMSTTSSDSVIHTPQHSSRPSSPLPPALKTPTSTSSFKPTRNIRFSTQPADVHVYESAPSSPKRKAIAFLPPPDLDNPSENQLKYVPKGRMLLSDDMDVDDLASPATDLPETQQPSKEPETKPSPTRDVVMDDEEGTPEDIRKRWFPSAATNEPSLDWMKQTSGMDIDNTSPDSLTTRYDLDGAPIPADLQESLPTHLGLHHHGMDQDRAGYTLDELLLLSRSTVPAQRASMLGVLAKIASKLATTTDDDVRTKILAVGLEALPERGSVGMRGVEVVWTTLVRKEGAFQELDITTLVPLSTLLRAITIHIHPATQTLPYTSLRQLLDILLHLSTSHATEILHTPDLVASVLHTFVTTSASPPVPSAVSLVDSIAQSSRANAQRIVQDGIADTFLKFIVVLPEEGEGIAVLSETLKLYTTLGKYGMYAITATTASESFTALGKYILQRDVRDALTVRYLNLLEVWITCAIDPHKTTPPHEILWSQVTGWGWASDTVMQLRVRVLSAGPGAPDDRLVLPAIWNVLSAWLEGSTINGVRAGEEEKDAVVQTLVDGESHDAEVDLILRVLEEDEDADIPRLGAQARFLHAAVRLANACCSNTPIPDLRGLLSEGTFRRILSFNRRCAAIKEPKQQPVSSLLAATALLDRRCGVSPPRTWLAFVGKCMSCLIPGDEELGRALLREVTGAISKEMVEEDGEDGEVWAKGGVKIILPFLYHALRRDQGEDEEHIPAEVPAPFVTTPASIQAATTLRSPQTAASASASSSKRKSSSGLPLRSDWCFSPLDALLHSGTAAVFKSLPRDWDHSETDVVRATLLLARVFLQDTDEDEEPLLTREDVVFNCMKVFMLEHGQSSSDSFGNDSASEVFRDSVVSHEMDLLLAPFRFGASLQATRSLPLPSLERTTQAYLGTATPFFQFYSDFLGLYDGVSFGHPTFGALLLPPLANAIYAPDYRKLLWGDYPHVVRLLTFEPQDVIGADLGDWLAPVEEDGEALGMYLKALCTVNGVRGFLRWVAVHHLACSVWPDLQGWMRLRQQASSPSGTSTTATATPTSETQTQQQLQRAKKILFALFSSAPYEAVREVVLYRQSLDPTLLRAPPICFEEADDDGWKRKRLEWVLSWDAGGSLTDRLKGLLLVPN